MANPSPRRAATKPAAAAKSGQLEETHVPSSDDALGETVVPDRAAAEMEKTVVGAQETGEGPSQAKSQAAGGAKKKKKTTQLGDFKVLKRLGKGGMGEVYLAVQVSLDRKVALKTLSKELAKKEDFVKRFIREARSMAKLQHPNVVQVYAADSVQGVHFAAIEFIDGQSMQDWMDQLNRLSVGDALHIALVCADALGHAHELNMVHRDIKPDNILVTKKGVVKVADFGLAKALDEDVSMTQSGTGLGTPLYMAPEQARNAKHVDHRSDIYALGSMLYYFLTGDLPFKGDSALELITAKETGKFTPIRRLNDEVPERLELMIEKMMMKDPQHRYASCEEIMRDLSGLQLDSPTLSFIERTGQKAAVRRGAHTVVGGATTASSKPALHLSSAQDAARTEAKKKPKGSGKSWIVQHKDPKGKPTISKMTTAQIQQGIRADIIDLTAQAKLSATDSFLPLAQYKEFSDLVEKQKVRASTQAKSSSMKEAFEKLDRQDRRRKRWGFLKRWAEGVGGLVGLIIYLAVIVGVLIGGGWAFIELGLPWIKGLMQ